MSGTYPTETCWPEVPGPPWPGPARSTENSAAAEVNGSSTNFASRGLSRAASSCGLGTNVAVPSLVRLVSFHGPSTTDQIGLDA